MNIKKSFKKAISFTVVFTLIFTSLALFDVKRTEAVGDEFNFEYMGISLGYKILTEGDKNTAAVSSVPTPLSGSVVIPSEVTNEEIKYQVTQINDSVFKSKTGITAVTLPDTLEVIGASAFESCTGLTSINIPDSVTSIGARAFYKCAALSSDLVIPNGVSTIGDRTFEGCSALENVSFPSTLTSIGSRAFYNCVKLVSDIQFQADGATIGKNAFFGCTALHSVSFSGNGIAIEDAAFSGCSGLTAAVISEGVVSIGKDAFKNCTGLTAITIPKTATAIGSSTFRGCSGLINITLEEGLTVLGMYMFQNCTGLTAITIPKTVTTIEGSTFTGCSGLTDVTLEEGLTLLGNGMFSNCTSLTAITLPESLTAIGNSIFYGCTGLTTITLPKKVTTIPQTAFYDCTGLTSVTLPEGLTSIEKNAFENCTGLTSIAISAGVTSIGDNTFKDCAALSTVYVKATAPPAITATTFPAGQAIKVMVPNGSVDAYKAADNWNAETLTILSETYDVSLDANGGSVDPDTIQVARDGQYGELPQPVWDGYVFDGWYTDKTEGQLIESGTMTDEAYQALYAHWKIDFTKFKDFTIADKTYNGSELKPDIVLKDGDTQLQEGTDYTVAYIEGADFINAGDVAVNIEGIGAYTGTISKAFRIVAKDVAGLTVDGITDKTYTGEGVLQDITVKYGEITLTEGTDYTVSYRDNTEIGEAVLTITGMGNYTGTAEKKFQINPQAVLGDIDGNKEIDMQDATALTRFASGWTPEEGTTLDTSVADLNGDGEVNMKDATLLTRFVAGWYPGKTLEEMKAEWQETP